MHGAWRDPQRGGGAPPWPQPAPAGAPPGIHTADVPTCLPGAARHQGQDPTDFTGTQAVPHRPGGVGQSDNQEASGHHGLCKATRRSVLPLSWGPGLAGFRGTSSSPRIPVPVCLGHRGPVGRSVWPWKGGQGSRPWSCAQDCKYEKPPRSQHRCKHTRVYLQAPAWVQIYPTLRSRDLDPETKRRRISFIGASGPWD